MWFETRADTPAPSPSALRASTFVMLHSEIFPCYATELQFGFWLASVTTPAFSISWSWSERYPYSEVRCSIPILQSKSNGAYDKFVDGQHSISYVFYFFLRRHHNRLLGNFHGIPTTQVTTMCGWAKPEVPYAVLFQSSKQDWNFFKLNLSVNRSFTKPVYIYKTYLVFI